MVGSVCTQWSMLPGKWWVLYVQNGEYYLVSGWLCVYIMENTTWYVVGSVCTQWRILPGKWLVLCVHNGEYYLVCGWLYVPETND